MKYDLSILIPARNEEWLARTVQDILEHKQGKTEIIIGLDGQWATPPIPQHADVTVFYSPVSIGQRGMQNQLARLSKAKYVMKLDAHCSMDDGFDVKMLEMFEECGDDVTAVPAMRNLHVFNWVCGEGHKMYQGKEKPCETCGNPMVKELIWYAKPSPVSTSYRFDKTLHFQYFGEYKEQQAGDYVETMSLQGSCFMLTREKYWSLNICDDTWGSWGQQGTEVACKTWLSGGRVLVNKKTWYAHLFRTNNFGGFPYPNPESEIEKARQKSRDLFLNDKYDKAVRPFQWIIDKFSPPDWGTTKGVVFYTDNQLDEKIATRCQENLRLAFNGKIVSVSLKPLEFGDQNIVLPLERGSLSMFKQTLAGLEALDTDIVFLCEHDVLYHPSHFDFTPQKNIVYFNTNVWRLRATDGLCVWTDDLQQVSGVCANRRVLIDLYRNRVEQIEKEGFDGHYEMKGENYQSVHPNIDIRHGKNLTKSKWRKEDFRNPKYAKGWRETYFIEAWGDTKNVL